MRNIFFLVFCFLCLIVLAQCGLERPLAAWDKPVSTGTLGTQFRFMTSANDVDDPSRLFQGYEVYYKINPEGVDFSVEDQTIEDANLLESKGFKRLNSAEDTWDPSIITKPLYKTDNADEGSSYEITIDFTDSGLCRIYDTDETRENFEFRRVTHYPSGNPSATEFYKRFSEFAADDSDRGTVDLTSRINGEEINVNLALYVFAYGRSISTQSFWIEIKSPPSYLFASQITIVYNDGT